MNQRLALLLMLILGVWVTPSLAQNPVTSTASVYNVTDVQVDVTDASAAKARDQAIAEAQRSAFTQLLERFGVDTSIGAKLSNDDLSTLVQNFEVRNERSSAVRYIGTFAVQFRPLAVRNFLNSKHAVFNDIQGPPVLVLPVVKTADNKTILWEEPTRWMKAWSDAAKDGGMVPVIVPTGTTEDKTQLTTTDAVMGKVEAIKSLIDSYHTAGAVVAVLNGSLDNPSTGFVVDLQHFGTGFDDGSEVEHMAVAGTSDKYALDSLLTQTIKQIRKKIEKEQKDNPKQAEMVAEKRGEQAAVPDADKGVTVWSDEAAPSRIAVTVQFNTLAEWANIQRRLLASTGVNRVDIESVGRGSTQIELGFTGKPEDIQLSVAQHGLRLTQDVLSGDWLLKGS